MSCTCFFSLRHRMVFLSEPENQCLRVEAPTLADAIARNALLRGHAVYRGPRHTKKPCNVGRLQLLVYVAEVCDQVAIAAHLLKPSIS